MEKVVNPLQFENETRPFKDDSVRNAFTFLVLKKYAQYTFNYRMQCNATRCAALFNRCGLDFVEFQFGLGLLALSPCNLKSPITVIVVVVHATDACENSRSSSVGTATSWHQRKLRVGHRNLKTKRQAAETFVETFPWFVSVPKFFIFYI